MSSAVSQVFSTPELLELILNHLPPSTLLLSQRVCSNFNNLINTSPILRQAIFLRPSPNASSEGEQWHINPLLRTHFHPFFSEGRHNPSVLKELDWAASPAPRSAFLRREASWRRMALTSPSSHMLQLARCIHMQDGDSYDLACMTFDETSAGVTMGTIYDIVQSWCPNHPVASFNLFIEDKEDTGYVDITLYLEMTVQCCQDSDDEDDGVNLTSDGEQVTVQKLDWRTARKEDIFEIHEMHLRRSTRRYKATKEREEKEREEKRMEGKRVKARERGVAVEEVSDVEDEVSDYDEGWDQPQQCGGRVYPRCRCGGRYL